MAHTIPRMGYNENKKAMQDDKQCLHHCTTKISLFDLLINFLFVFFEKKLAQFLKKAAIVALY